jgi:hypothetical protein
LDPSSPIADSISNEWRREEGGGRRRKEEERGRRRKEEGGGRTVAKYVGSIKYDR